MSTIKTNVIHIHSLKLTVPPWNRPGPNPTIHFLVPVVGFRQGIGKYTIHDSEFFGGPTKFGFRHFCTWPKTVGKRTRPVNGAPGFVLAAGWLLLSVLLWNLKASHSAGPCWESSNFATMKLLILLGFSSMTSIRLTWIGLGNGSSVRLRPELNSFGINCFACLVWS